MHYLSDRILHFLTRFVGTLQLHFICITVGLTLQVEQSDISPHPT